MKHEDRKDMSTAAFVIQKTNEGFRGIRTSCDGMPDRMLKILNGNYANESEVTKLMDLGSANSVCENPIERVTEYSNGKPIAVMDLDYTKPHLWNESAISGETFDDCWKGLRKTFGPDFVYLFDGEKWIEC